MKRSLALSGAIHALCFLALLLGGLPRVEVSAPGAIQVLLIEGAGGEEKRSLGPAAGLSPRLRRVSAEPSPRIARAHPVGPPRPSARRVNRPAVESAVKASHPARMQRKPIAAGRPAGEAEGVIGGSSRSVKNGSFSGQGEPDSGAGRHAETPGASGESPGKERDHRIAIIRRRIEEALVYPREARRRGIEGTSQVRFDLTDAGRLRTLVLARSSGRKLLDDASLETVERAQPFPFVDGTLIVPVVFRISGMSGP